MPRTRDDDPYDPTDRGSPAPADPDYPTPPGYHDPVLVGYAPDGTAVYEQQGQLITGGSGNWSPWTGDRASLTTAPTAPGPSPPPPTPTPTPTPPPGGGSLTSPYPGTFTPPNPQYPTFPQTPVFTPPSYTPPPAFQTPTLADAQADPGYEFARHEGEHALLANRAMRGILGTGGALKDLASWNQDYATQRYSDVYNRQRQTYDTNYQTQYFDPYNFAYRAAVDAFQPQMVAYTTQAQAGQRANELDYSHAWDRFMQDYNSWRDSRNFKWDSAFQLATA
jgi:hypothetical protein